MANMRPERGGPAIGWSHMTDTAPEYQMETASDYRKYAEECRGLAKNAKTAQQREILIEMSHAWLQLAEEAERKTPRSKK